MCHIRSTAVDAKVGSTDETDQLGSIYRILEVRAKIFKGVEEFLPETQGHNLAVTVLCVPYSLSNGLCVDAKAVSTEQSDKLGSIYRILEVREKREQFKRF